MPRRKLTPRTPGAPIAAPERAPEPLPTVPESFLAEIAALTNEGLIALDTAERGGENRPEYLAAIDAELKPRIAQMAGVVVSEELTGTEIEQLKDSKPGDLVRVPPEHVHPLPGLPTPGDIDPSQLTTAVLTTEGWVLPSVSPPPPIR